jgi:integrase
VRLVPFFGDRDIRAIRVGDVQRFFDHCREIGRPGGQRSIEIVLEVLQLILAHAQSQDLIPSNPVDAWKAVRGRRKGTGLQPIDRTKVLSTEELGHLLWVARTDFPESYPPVLLLADTGCRIGEALALRWSDVDLVTGIVRIERSVDHAGRLGLTKTRRGRVVELSTRLREVLNAIKPDVSADEALVFPSQAGGPVLSGNFRSRVFRRLVRRAFGPGRSLTPHVLRHSCASLHLARGTNLKWAQEAGGWASAKMLLDVYGHFMPTETRGFADAITAPDGPGSAARHDRASATQP